MTLLDVHPEHLLDAFLRDELCDEEQAQLNTHLMQCDACRLELGLAGVLKQDIKSSSHAGRLGVQQDSAVEGALSAMLADQVLRVPTLRALPLTHVRLRRRLGQRVLVGGLLFSLGAAAAVLVMRQLREVPAETTQPAASQSVSSPQGKNSTKLELAPKPLSVPNEAKDEAVQGEAESDGGKLKELHPEPASATPTGLSAAELFAEATKLRRARNTAQAAASYQTLQRTYPNSQEALVSRLAMGQLLLADQPSQALAQFDGYLKRGGPLRVEALVGKARALDKLGNSQLARAIWTEVLESAPDSIYAEQARRHLSPPAP